MPSGTMHIVGAGLAGLSAGVELTRQGKRVVLHELARRADAAGRTSNRRWGSRSITAIISYCRETETRLPSSM